MKAGSSQAAARRRDMPRGGAAVDGAVLDRLPSCAQSCVSPSSSLVSACGGDLGCACETPGLADSAAHCFSSSCNAEDLSIAIALFSSEICPSLPQDIGSPSRWSSPELRRKPRRRERRSTLPGTTTARAMPVARRDIGAAERRQHDAGRSSARALDRRGGAGAGLSDAAKAGIAIAAVAIVTILAGSILYIYLRRRQAGVHKVSSLDSGKKPVTRKERQRKKQLDEAHKKEEEQLQQQLQQMQKELQQQKLLEQEARKIQMEKRQKEENKYVAELFELPGWMPERQPTPMNELADTGQPRYEMMTEANIVEMGAGYPEPEDEDERIYGRHDHFARRSRSYTAELSGGPVPHDSSTDDDGDMTPLKRSHSDSGPIISPADHISSQLRSPYDIVSPPSATVPAAMGGFARSDWRSGGGAQVQTPLRSPHHPAVPLGLTVDIGTARAWTGKRSKGQRADMPSADIASQRHREAWD